MRFNPSLEAIEHPYPRVGEDRLSEDKVGESGSPDERRTRPGVPPLPKKKKKRVPRAGDIGRALRSVYDETLREDVPPDFNDLLGKLS
jgi:hypothetical protein